jgi:hypothetical protein
LRVLLHMCRCELLRVLLGMLRVLLSMLLGMLLGMGGMGSWRLCHRLRARRSTLPTSRGGGRGGCRGRLLRRRWLLLLGMCHGRLDGNRGLMVLLLNCLWSWRRCAIRSEVLLLGMLVWAASSHIRLRVLRLAIPGGMISKLRLLLRWCWWLLLQRRH